MTRSNTARRFGATALVATLLAAASVAQAYDPDWKRGRLYFRAVCTACHVDNPVGGINPSSRLKVEWVAYLGADKHAKGKDTVSQYLSQAYRKSIATSNRAAAKFADVPDAELGADVKAFLLKGAKDGDAPASCS
jgi:mono/diheme cytochrome c family protein